MVDDLCSQIRCVWLVTRGEVEEGGERQAIDEQCGGFRSSAIGITPAGVGLGVGGQNVVGDTVPGCVIRRRRGRRFGRRRRTGLRYWHPFFVAVDARDGAALGALVGPGVGPGVGLASVLATARP